MTNAQLERIGSEYRNYLLTLPDDVTTQSKSLPAIDHQRYMDAKHSNGFLSGGGIGDFFKKALGHATNIVKWGLKNKEHLAKGYEVGKKLLGKGAAKPKRDLFYE